MDAKKTFSELAAEVTKYKAILTANPDLKDAFSAEELAALNQIVQTVEVQSAKLLKAIPQENAPAKTKIVAPKALPTEKEFLEAMKSYQADIETAINNKDFDTALSKQEEMAYYFDAYQTVLKKPEDIVFWGNIVKGLKTRITNLMTKEEEKNWAPAMKATIEQMTQKLYNATQQEEMDIILEQIKDLEAELLMKKAEISSESQAYFQDLLRNLKEKITSHQKKTGFVLQCVDIPWTASIRFNRGQWLSKDERLDNKTVLANELRRIAEATFNDVVITENMTEEQIERAVKRREKRFREQLIDLDTAKVKWDAKKITESSLDLKLSVSFCKKQKEHLGKMIEYWGIASITAPNTKHDILTATFSSDIQESLFSHSATVTISVARDEVTQTVWDFSALTALLDTRKAAINTPWLRVPRLDLSAIGSVVQNIVREETIPAANADIVWTIALNTNPDTQELSILISPSSEQLVTYLSYKEVNIGKTFEPCHNINAADSTFKSLVTSSLSGK